ncbi:energy transducer TonB [Sphingomonas hengshuiensis]|uniref:Energy transducer TonB n=1 Tax=Sphingomonas hengshuiensis TaxID=1609977 RepID=A0A7U4JB34_9SPHN|nr:energy transducer TonB [Sphingomonas hengshuiensis]AJP73556.1 energy transducer TonB [Sphingomonas hengshuiensis]
MYADTRYTAPKSRTVSLGAALAINGAILAGLIYSVPDILKPKPPTTLIVDNVPLPLDPPEVKKEPPKAQQPTTPDPTPYIPKPQIETFRDPIIAGTDALPTDPPAAGRDLPTGPTTVLDPPPPLPPLVNSAQDPRYLKDFQPAYPAAELRAERNGTVSVRVLIGTDGRVKDVRELAATSPAFFEATRRQALAKWRFKPATRGGVPEESWKVMNVRFELENQ